MFDLEKWIMDYIDFCQYQKELNSKTIKAYNIDLKQFYAFVEKTDFQPSKAILSNYITYLHKITNIKKGLLQNADANCNRPYRFRGGKSGRTKGQEAKKGIKEQALTKKTGQKCRTI